MSVSIDQLRATKEYIAGTTDTGAEKFRFIIDKISKDTDGNVVKINITMLDAFRNKLEYKVKEFNFENIVEPISATEFFMMYTNFLNFFRSGINQDFRYAKSIGDSIVESLLIRSYIHEGSGKFEDYDTLMLNQFIAQHSTLMDMDTIR